MGTSNLAQLISSLPNIPYHQCTSSQTTNSSQLEDDQNTNTVSRALKIQIPSTDGEFEGSHGENDLKTPRSIEHRIPVAATCPPAPRKARLVPVNRKRKASFFPVVGVPAHNFIVYVDAMLALNEVVYVPDIVVGDLGKGDRAKKLKLLAAPVHEYA